MRATKMKKTISKTRLLLAPMVAVAFTATAHAAAPGITGPTFNLTAQPAYLTQPDGQAIYSWGYGCNGAPGGFAPAAIHRNAFLQHDAGSRPHADRHGRADGHGEPDEWSAHRGRQHLDSVSRLSGDNDGRCRRPADAGGGAWRHGDLHVHRLIARERAPITAERKATCRSRWACTARSSCSRPPSPRPARPGWPLRTWLRKRTGVKADFRLAAAAYDHAKSCYDREYLFQFSEMDPNIHNQALAQVAARLAARLGLRDAVSRWRPSLTIPRTS